VAGVLDRRPAGQSAELAALAGSAGAAMADAARWLDAAGRQLALAQRG